MKIILFSIALFACNVCVNASPLPKSLENKYCIDDACLFTPLDKVSPNLISSNPEIGREIDRLMKIFPICDGSGAVGSFEAVSSKGKSLWVGINAFPEAKGNHARLSTVRATVAGVYSREQMHEIFYDLVKRLGFPKKAVVERSSSFLVAKPDAGQEVILYSGLNSDNLVVEFSMNGSYIDGNDFRKMPECKSPAPKF